jgi:hypothetical protein
MILGTYRHVWIAHLKQAWSSIQGLPIVTLPSLNVSNVAPAPQDTGRPAAASPDPTAPEDALALIAAHLQYLGYEVRLDPKGWSDAQHPHRYRFDLRSWPLGVRLHCTVGIGAAIGNSRAAWLDFLNTANGHGHIAQFSLSEDSMGRHVVRIRAFVSGAYSRPAFALAMDMWHADLDLVRQKPEFHQEGEAGERADVAVTVH